MKSPIRPGPIRLRIDRLAFGGDGVGRHEGLAVFVSGSTPGDLVDVEITQSTRTFARARITRLIEASPDRTEPPCSTYPECGGCQWQHINASAQFQAKIGILRHALRHFGEPEFNGHPAQESFGYRRRARLGFVTDKSLHAGFRARQSDTIIDTIDCLQLVPALQQVLPPLRIWLGALGKTSGQVELLANHNGEVHVAASVRNLPEGFTLTLPEWCAGIEVADRHNRHRAGTPTLVLDERGLRATARAFTQANAAQDEKLRKVVIDSILRTSPKSVLEFHAGIGNFTLDLAAAGTVVSTVESNPEACTLLRNNLEGHTISVQQADAEYFDWKEKPDCILLDPPREGAPQLIRHIAGSRVKHVVYVSCDPMTLARDIKVLTEAKFKLKRVDLVDMMPQTYHIEAACFLSRG